MIKVTLITNTSRNIIMANEEDTVRDILNDNDVNYGAGKVAIDGYSLNLQDLDSTLPDLGIHDGCYLSVVVKAENAASATVCGNAVVLKSTMKREDIALIEKYRPEALIVKDEDGNPEFAIGITERSAGHVNKNGVTFGPATTADGNATVTILFDPDADVTAAIEDQMGSAILKLGKLEEKLPEIIEEIKTEQEQVRACITVV